MIRIKHIICLLIVFLLQFTMVPVFSETVPDDIITVLLTKASLTDRADISLDGLYSVNNIYFQRGSQITAAVQNNRIYLYYESLTMDCGKELLLMRHPDPGSSENGFRFTGNYPLHPGDLKLTISNGLLIPLLIINVEDYLWGVVPSEMSDSYPIEALKAQAIAARTYALKKKKNSTGYYDLVDNTNDQAYNGIQKEMTRSLQAIESTKGICAFDQQENLINCYYSASNGGQTEAASHVWGGPDYDYLVIKDDPYDLENPGSTVRTFRISKDFDLNEKSFQMLLSDAAAKEYSEYTIPESISIKKILNLQLKSPQHTGSRVMTAAIFTLLCSGLSHESDEEEIYLEDAYTPDDKNPFSVITVRINIFPEIESVCNLSINSGTNNEIFNVSEDDETFVLTSRRFGHGVGMSQRGAQQLAEQYQWPLERIWDFYYPGTVLKTIAYKTPSTPRSTISAAFLTTPGPAATATPRPTLMPIDASIKDNSNTLLIVDKISSGSYLNLRSQPNTAGTVLRQLYYGQKLVLVDEIDDFWIRVKTDVIEGYVMKEFVSIISE